MCVYWLFLHPFPSSWASPIPWDTTVLKLDQLIDLNPAVASKYSSEKKSRLMEQSSLFNFKEIATISHSNLQQLQPYQSAAINIEGKSFYQQKDYNFMRGQMMVSIFLAANIC